jgi:hypothetical protein
MSQPGRSQLPHLKNQYQKKMQEKIKNFKKILIKLDKHDITN